MKYPEDTDDESIGYEYDEDGRLKVEDDEDELSQDDLVILLLLFEFLPLTIFSCFSKIHFAVFYSICWIFFLSKVFEIISSTNQRGVLCRRLRTFTPWRIRLPPSNQSRPDLVSTRFDGKMTPNNTRNPAWTRRLKAPWSVDFLVVNQSINRSKARQSINQSIKGSSINQSKACRSVKWSFGHYELFIFSPQTPIVPRITRNRRLVCLTQKASIFRELRTWYVWVSLTCHQRPCYSCTTKKCFLFRLAERSAPFCCFDREIVAGWGTKRKLSRARAELRWEPVVRWAQHRRPPSVRCSRQTSHWGGPLFLSVGVLALSDLHTKAALFCLGVANWGGLSAERGGADSEERADLVARGIQGDARAAVGSRAEHPRGRYVSSRRLDQWIIFRIWLVSFLEALKRKGCLAKISRLKAVIANCLKDGSREVSLVNPNYSARMTFGGMVLRLTKEFLESLRADLGNLFSPHPFIPNGSIDWLID